MASDSQLPFHSISNEQLIALLETDVRRWDDVYGNTELRDYLGSLYSDGILKEIGCKCVTEEHFSHTYRNVGNSTMAATPTFEAVSILELRIIALVLEILIPVSITVTILMLITMGAV